MSWSIGLTPGRSACFLAEARAARPSPWERPARCAAVVSERCLARADEALSCPRADPGRRPSAPRSTARYRAKGAGARAWGASMSDADPPDASGIASGGIDAIIFENRTQFTVLLCAVRVSTCRTMALRPRPSRRMPQLGLRRAAGREESVGGVEVHRKHGVAVPQHLQRLHLHPDDGRLCATRRCDCRGSAWRRSGADAKTTRQAAP